MTYARLQVFDPLMCCSSGVCGPNVDPELVRFSRDLDQLRKQGVEVERFSLSTHPDVFARQESVKEALSNEGNECLPLVLADGAIVSMGVYPSLSELMDFAGIGHEAKEEQPAAASPHDSKSETAACGPGCNCGTPSKGKKIKTAIALVALLAVVALIYKGVSAQQAAPNGPAAANASVFAVAQVAGTTPGTASQPSDATVDGKVGEKAASKAESAKAVNKIGEYLGSLNDLNKVALSQDAVLIFIPGAKDESVQDGTNAAVLAAQKTLKTKSITLGLYTLRAESPDYSAIAKQVQPPAIVVASKGRGMAAVTGEVTEPKLLQAFVASSSAGGCGPSGCGPSSAGCK